MSWFNNYISGEYSNNVIPDSYDISSSNTWNQPASNTSQQEDEVVSGVHYRDNAEFDLNIPVDEPYGYGYDDSGEPFVQKNYADNAVQFDLNIPVEDPYGYGDGGEPSFVQKDYVDGDEPSFFQKEYSVSGEPLDDAEGSYPIIVSFYTDRVFKSCEDLVNWVQNRGTEHGYVITVKRTKEKAIWFLLPRESMVSSDDVKLRSD